MTLRSVQFVGDGQALLLSRLYARLVARRAGEHAHHRRQISAPALPPVPPHLLFVQQSSACLPEQWIDNAQVIPFPLLECRHLWPFAHPDERGYRDFYLDHGRARGLPNEQIIADYATLDIARVSDLLGLARADQARLEHLEALTGMTVPAARISEQDRQSYLAPRMPAPRVMAEFAQSLFARASAAVSMDELLAAIQIEARDFCQELPIHPSVIEALGLTYFVPAPRFATSKGSLNFEDHARAYLAGDPQRTPTLDLIAEPIADSVVQEAHRFVADGDDQRAERSLTDAMMHLRQAPGLPAMLCELLLRAERPEAAEAAALATSLAPDHDRNFRNLAAAMLAMGELDDALLAAEKAASLNPFDPDNRNLCAEILEALGRRTEAIQTLGIGLLLNACNGQSFSLLGNFHWRAGALAEAAEAFATGSRMDPAREDLRLCLAEVEQEQSRLGY